MDNKNKKDRSIFEKRGFYVALYSCIGVVLVLAVGMTYNTMNRSRPGAASNAARLSSQPLAETPRGPVASGNLAGNDILGRADEVRGSAPGTDYQNGQAVESRAPANQTTPAAPSTTPAPATSGISQAGQPDGVRHDELNYYQEALPVSQPTGLTLADVIGANQQTPAEPEPAESERQSSEQASAEWYDDPVADEVFLADPVFSVFSGTEDMLWPVSGEIVMDFSMDRLIHDVTLNQFRTNDKISVSATVGSQVRVSADGVVRSVTNDRRLGNTVVVEHGNGWFTTYSQLQDHILVEEGDVVNRGQVIGGVGEPSIFYTLLGSHLSFRVTRDDAPVNPLVVLAAN